MENFEKEKIRGENYFIFKIINYPFYSPFFFSAFFSKRKIYLFYLLYSIVSPIIIAHVQHSCRFSSTRREVFCLFLYLVHPRMPQLWHWPCLPRAHFLNRTISGLNLRSFLVSFFSSGIKKLSPTQFGWNNWSSNIYRFYDCIYLDLLFLKIVSNRHLIEVTVTLDFHSYLFSLFCLF